MIKFKLKRIVVFIFYFITRPHSKGHGIHSPFLYSFTVNVLNNKHDNQKISDIIQFRKQLLVNNKLLKINDFGAGSRRLRKSLRPVKHIAKYSSTSVKYGKLLYNTVEYLKPVTILEFGTGLGIGSIFMASADPGASVISLEGAMQLAQEAHKNCELLGLSNIKITLGTFNESLPKILQSNKRFDLIFIDGNHTGNATIEYFENCLPHLNIPGTFIVDDIRWSQDMLSAWNKIIKHENVSVSVDLFQMGLVFINPALTKQHFKIYY